MTNIEKLSERLSLLEADSNIKALKYRYWNACDSKNPNDILKCFDDGEVSIDYEDFGVFSSSLDMVNKFKVNSCHPHLIEQHAGKNPVIKFITCDQAKGSWSMVYNLEDTQKLISLTLTGIYDDLYVKKKNGSWKIKETTFRKSGTCYRSKTEKNYLRAKAGRTLGFKKTI